MYQSRLLYLIFFINCFIAGCSKQQYPAEYGEAVLEVNSAIENEEKISEMIAPYKEALDVKMKREIGMFAHDLRKMKPEGELNNFTTDAVQEYFEQISNLGFSADFTLMNYGGIRVTTITKGAIIVEEMFELMPFENEIVILEIPGDLMLQLFERIAEDNGWPVSKNIQLKISDQKIETLLINGKELDQAETYKIFTSDYLANGGDGLEFFVDLTRLNTNLKLRDVYIEYCEYKQSLAQEISMPLDGRITIEE